MLDLGGGGGVGGVAMAAGLDINFLQPQFIVTVFTKTIAWTSDVVQNYLVRGTINTQQ